jgi:pimeloyl-ACP methyl ester carboxylesterase
MGVDTIGPVAEFLAPGSKVVIVEGTGHFLQVEKPDEVNDHIIAFLAD